MTITLYLEPFDTWIRNGPGQGTTRTHPGDNMTGSRLDALTAMLSDESVSAAVKGLHSAGLAFPANEFNELTCEECGYAFRWPGISETEQRERWETHRMHHAIRAVIDHVTGNAQ